MKPKNETTYGDAVRNPSWTKCGKDFDLDAIRNAETNEFMLCVSPHDRRIRRREIPVYSLVQASHEDETEFLFTDWKLRETNWTRQRFTVESFAGVTYEYVHDTIVLGVLKKMLFYKLTKDIIGRNPIAVNYSHASGFLEFCAGCERASDMGLTCRLDDSVRGPCPDRIRQVCLASWMVQRTRELVQMDLSLALAGKLPK